MIGDLPYQPVQDFFHQQHCYHFSWSNDPCPCHASCDFLAVWVSRSLQILCRCRAVPGISPGGANTSFPPSCKKSGGLNCDIFIFVLYSWLLGGFWSSEVFIPSFLYILHLFECRIENVFLRLLLWAEVRFIDLNSFPALGISKRGFHSAIMLEQDWDIRLWTLAELVDSLFFNLKVRPRNCRPK